jgi:predicted RNase H-like HicB family nuclease
MMSQRREIPASHKKVPHNQKGHIRIRRFLLNSLAVLAARPGDPARRNYNECGRVVETVTANSIRITLGRETDGRWWADVESMPGVMAYGDIKDSAIAAVRALALRVAADCIDHGEVPAPLANLFSAA